MKLWTFSLQSFHICKHILKRTINVSSLQNRSIYSLSGKWDEEYPTTETLHRLEQHWKQHFLHHPTTGSGKHGNKYILAMFPYPSGELHMGHVRVYTVSDTLARFYRAQGYQVIHPIGWDAFGLPAENAAIERGVSPADWTQYNINQMKEQFNLLGCQFDWWRELRTCSPEYYKWTQDLFLKLHARGLVYRKHGYVNWDPVDQTVLADEQVDMHGLAWRSGAKVEKRLLHQWYIRTTRFCQALYEGLSSAELSDWQKVAAIQRSWIGYCSGHNISLRVKHTDKNNNSSNSLTVFTEHPELLPAVSFIAVRSDHALAAKTQYTGTSNTIDITSLNGTQQQRTTCRLLTAQATDPLSERLIPIIVSDDLPYVTETVDCYLGYGSGSELDKQICQQFNFNVNVIDKDYSILEYMKQTAMKEPDELNNSEGTTVNKRDESTTDADILHKTNYSSSNSSSDSSVRQRHVAGVGSSEARETALRWLSEAGAAPCPASGRQKDWLISRQRYWGTPIPIVHCGVCGALPVPADQLPVLLPPPGAEEAARWAQCLCHKCGGAALRETDTMDTFVDSSWYFLRFLDPNNTHAAFGSEVVNKHMPVDIYVGGEEHANRHLYYARFVQHFLHTEKLTNHKEPFQQLVLIGRVNAPAYVRVTDGKYLRPDAVDATVAPPVEKESRLPVQVIIEKMSKSKYNGIDPRSVAVTHGTDMMRLGVLRGETPRSNRTWTEDSLVPVHKWINLIWRSVGKFVAAKQSGDSGDPACPAVRRALRDSRNCTVKGVTSDYNSCLINFAIRRLETYTHDIRSVPLSSLHDEEYERSLATLLVLLAPMTPHIAAELWQAFAAHASLTYKDGTVHDQSWPEVDEGFKMPIKIFVSVNDQIVHKKVLSGDETTLSEEVMLEHVLEVPRVRDRVNRQRVLRTRMTNTSDYKIDLDIYTLDEIGLLREKNARKENKLKKKRLSVDKRGTDLKSEVAKEKL